MAEIRVVCFGEKGTFAPYSLTKLNSMKKFTLGLSGLAIAAIVFFISCQKEKSTSTKGPVGIENPVAFYSKHFLTDTNFYNFVESNVINNLKINAIIGVDNAFKISMLDSFAVYDAASGNITTQILLEEAHPNYANLSIEEKQQIFNVIKDSVTSITFRQNYPTNPLILLEQSTIPRIREIGVIATIEKVKNFCFCNITSGEFWACTVQSLGASVAAYGDIIGEVRGLAKLGGSVLGWTDVFQIAWRVVKNASPWYKVAGLALDFGGCLWGAGLS